MPESTAVIDAPLSCQSDHVPEQLKAYKQWVLWSVETRDGRATKVLRELNGSHARSNDRTTWTTYDEVKEWAQIGFVFSPDDPFCGLDLDNSLDEAGRLKPWAREIVEKINSYTEISPSGKGCKIFGIGKLPRNRIFKIEGDTRDGEKQSQLEMFDHGKFFAMTGNILGLQTEIRDCQKELDELYARYDREHQQAESPRKLSEQEILAKAGKAKNGGKFKDLWHGITAAYGNDESAADQALCCMLAFWTGNDATRIDSMFRASGLYRDKWERSDYRDRTINNAIAMTGKTYDPARVDEIDFCLDPAALIRPKHRRWKMNTLIEDRSIVQSPVLIEGLLRRGEVMNIVAGSKSRKSWAILEAAISISQGSLWMNRFQCNKASVLLIDNELRLPTLKHRSEAVCNAKGVTPPDNIHILPVRGLQYNLIDVPAYIEDVRPDVVILDALYRLFPDKFDENSNTDMTKLYNSIDQIATTTGCAVIIVHHASKGTQSLKSITDVGAGAGAQSRAADTHLVIRPTKADGDSTIDDTAYLDIVARSFPPTPRTVIRWNYPLWTADASAPVHRSEDEVLHDFVDRCYRAEPEPSDTAFERSGFSHRQFEKLRSRALSVGLIDFEKGKGNGRNYYKLPNTADNAKAF